MYIEKSKNYLQTLITFYKHFWVGVLLFVQHKMD